MTKPDDGIRRGLVQRVLDLLVGVTGKELEIVWQLTLALRRRQPRTESAQKKPSVHVQISARRWYLVRWIEPRLIGAED